MDTCYYNVESMFLYSEACLVDFSWSSPSGFSSSSINETLSNWKILSSNLSKMVLLAQSSVRCTKLELTLGARLYSTVGYFTEK